MIITNLYSGTILSFSVIPEPMIVPIIKLKNILEDSYTGDFFWMQRKEVCRFNFCSLLVTPFQKNLFKHILSINTNLIKKVVFSVS